MDDAPAWPESLAAWLRSRGLVSPVVHLAAPGGAGAWRVGVAPDGVVIKLDASEREHRVYRIAGPALARAAVDIPALRGEGRGWIALEDAGPPLPCNRWQGDPQAVALLARLHALPSVWWSTVLGSPWTPCWTAAMNRDATAHLPTEVRACRFAALERLRAAFDPTAAGRPLSGDANATNWSVRPDGRPVLLDWGRAGVGHPAVDLAILLPGAGWDNGKPARALAAMYAPLAAWPGAVRDLARAIDLAKAWHVVEFVAEHGPLSPPYMEQLWRHVARLGRPVVTDAPGP